MMKKCQSYLKTVLLLFFSAIFSITLPLPIHALTNSEWEFYNANGIYYYNPQGGSNPNCYPGDVSVFGSTAAEKIWNALRTFLSPEQAAGALGNLAHESGLNPVRFYTGIVDKLSDGEKVSEQRLLSNEAFAVGLAQWYYPTRRQGMINYVKNRNSNLIKYFTDPLKYSGRSGHGVMGDQALQMIGESDFNQLIQIEIEYLKSEIQNKDGFKGFLQTSSVEDATDFFLRRIENPSSDEGALQSLYKQRLQTAQAFYQQFKNYSPSDSGNNKSADLSSLVVIGNSLIGSGEHGVQQYLKKKLKDDDNEVSYIAGDYFTNNSNATKTGKTVINDLKNSNSLRKNIFYALGANDLVQQGDALVPTITQADIDEVVNLVGSDHNLYFLTNYTLNADFTAVNNMLKQTANKHSNVYIVDYANLVSKHPEYFEDNDYGGNDGIHLNNKGYTEFAKLIASSLKTITGGSNSSGSILTSAGCTYAGDLQSTIEAYAWSTYRGKDITPTDGYQAAIARRLNEKKYVGGKEHPGIDCGGFVTAVMQDSGYAPNYNSFKSNTASQEQWVKLQNWKLLNADENTPVDTSILQIGDVAFSTGHTFIYVGNISFETKVASASLDERAPMSGIEGLARVYNTNEVVRWYRKVDTI